MPCTIGVICCAAAAAVELSLRTFSASAALIGAARFAFTSDIAARSGSASTLSECSSLSMTVSVIDLSFRWVWCCDGTRLDALRDRRHLLGACERGRVVRQDVRGERQ